MIVKSAPEHVVHRQLCDYVRMTYPLAIFNSDGAGNNLSRAQAGMAKMLRSGSGFPDFFLAEPRGKYHGLFLELKREGTTIFLKSGKLTTSEHIVKQERVLDELQQRGYAADFACGIKEAIIAIEWYMKQ